MKVVSLLLIFSILTILGGCCLPVDSNQGDQGSRQQSYSKSDANEEHASGGHAK